MNEYISTFLAQADRAAPFMDEGWSGAGWKPSEMLRIGFFVLLTGPHPEQSAVFANDMLDAARDLSRRGLEVNPFTAA